MDGSDRQSAAGPVGDDTPELSATTSDPGTPAPEFDESLGDEIAALIDNTRNYATAEAQFQKTRAKLAGRHVGVASLAVAVALIMFHIALLALAVGLVIALEPLVTIWGAIAIVVGALLIITALLIYLAVKRASRLRALFSGRDEA